MCDTTNAGVQVVQNAREKVQDGKMTIDAVSEALDESEAGDARILADVRQAYPFRCADKDGVIGSVSNSDRVGDSADEMIHALTEATVWYVVDSLT